MRRFKQYLGAEMKEKSAADINMATTYGKFTAIADIRVSNWIRYDFHNNLI
jgi:hypothetical protein